MPVFRRKSLRTRSISPIATLRYQIRPNPATYLNNSPPSPVSPQGFPQTIPKIFSCCSAICLRESAIRPNLKSPPRGLKPRQRGAGNLNGMAQNVTGLRYRVGLQDRKGCGTDKLSSLSFCGPAMDLRQRAGHGNGLRVKTMAAAGRKTQCNLGWRPPGGSKVHWKASGCVARHEFGFCPDARRLLHFRLPLRRPETPARRPRIRAACRRAANAPRRGSWQSGPPGNGR